VGEDGATDGKPVQNTIVMTISIVTVVYNSAALLGRTVKSVAEQTYEGVEYIVVDGGSTDGTLDVIKGYEGSIARWTSGPDRGIYDAMNKGTAMTSGEWICFLNAGDVFPDSRTLALVAEALEAHAASDVVYGNILVERDGELVERVASGPTNKHRMYFCHQSAFVKTELARRMPYDVEHKMSADFKFFKQCYLQGRLLTHVNRPFVIYDTSGVSHTRRVRGLLDNIAVIRETDRGMERVKFVCRLLFTILMLKIRGK
jgi:glycosyltransferase involved in cell wall biosynthesis